MNLKFYKFSVFGFSSSGSYNLSAKLRSYKDIFCYIRVIRPNFIITRVT